MADNADVWRSMAPFGALLAISAVIVTAGLLAVLRPLLRRVALATPNARSSHREPTPQGGGLAVVATTLALGMVAVAATSFYPAGTVERLIPVFAATLLLAGVGAVDDIFSLGLVPRLLAQGLALAMVLAALPDDLRVLPDAPMWLERGLLFVGGVAFVNMVNFMDGIDWMMVAEVVPVSVGIVLIAALDGLPPEVPLVALLLAGAMIGFAPYNRPVARLFLGDVGSLPIGLLLGWLLLAVAAAGHLAAAVLLPLYFIADTTVTLLRRVREGARVWEAHRTHFYQRAGENGFGTLEIVGRVFAVNLVLVALAAVTVVVPGRAASSAALLAGVALVAWLLTSFAQSQR